MLRECRVYVRTNTLDTINTTDVVPIVLISENCWTDFEVYIDRNEEYDIFCIKDKGPGFVEIKERGLRLLHYHFQPTPARRIPAKFDRFRSERLGLPLTNALLDIMGGYVTLRTKSRGNPPVTYDTRQENAQGTVYPLALQCIRYLFGDTERGCEFTIYRPREF